MTHTVVVLEKARITAVFLLISTGIVGVSIE